ncbi:TIM-barrel domain-containing protein [Amygdalobacter nucleatus]|uniref:TIM-barrel domain-containing protein n=1 Tax=Amygdalobacter nucleatus TaxID=3029274 RepID=UPI0027A80E49|nr:TIM-barrel domain-containing protein [Amygdalobacter nucleatus]WEG37020.1 glycoside hydrolase family 31 protein [Amygdalobacter nucleatus]
MLQLAKQQVWLPDGVYYDFFTGVQYQGDRFLSMYRPLDSIPVLVKAGSVIALKTKWDVTLAASDSNTEI